MLLLHTGLLHTLHSSADARLPKPGLPLAAIDLQEATGQRNNDSQLSGILALCGVPDAQVG